MCTKATYFIRQRALVKWLHSCIYNVYCAWQTFAKCLFHVIFSLFSSLHRVFHELEVARTKSSFLNIANHLFSGLFYMTQSLINYLLAVRTSQKQSETHPVSIKIHILFYHSIFGLIYRFFVYNIYSALCGALSLMSDSIFFYCETSRFNLARSTANFVSYNL